MASRPEIIEQLEAWQASGMSRAAYAREHGIAINTFHYWHKRYGAVRQPKIPPAFVEVPDTSPARTPGSARVQLALPDGLVITVY